MAAIDIACEAGGILAGRFGRETRTDAKGSFDLVTAADRAVESIIVDRIRSEFPAHTVIAEESGHAGTSSVYRWHVDPLDGTKNFSRGYPAFAVSLALEQAGELTVGVVFDPLRRELFAAERGAGAFCNDRRLRVSGAQRLEDCLVATGFPSASRHRNTDMYLLNRTSSATQGQRRSGSSALDLCYVACGRIDAFWDVALSSWDIAAGVVLVSEAGGRCTDLRGGPVALTAPDLLAANAAIHEQLVRLFGEAGAGAA